MKRTMLSLLTGLTFLAGCDHIQTNTKKPHSQRVYGLAALKGDPRLGEEVDKICFARNINGFHGLDQRTLVLNKNVHDDYVVETYGPCVDLDYAWEIALKSVTSCLAPHDEVIITRGSSVPNSDPFTRTCRIKSIHKWNEKALKAKKSAWWNVVHAKHRAPYYRYGADYYRNPGDPYGYPTHSNEHQNSIGSSVLQKAKAKLGHSED